MIIDGLSITGSSSNRGSRVVGAMQGDLPLAASLPKPTPNPLRKLPAIVDVLQHMDALLCQNIHMSKLLSCLKVRLRHEAACLKTGNTCIAHFDQCPHM